MSDRVAAALIVTIGLVVGALILQPEPTPEAATIAGRGVPAVHCQEDEVIGWVGVDTLACINFEEVGQ